MPKWLYVPMHVISNQPVPRAFHRGQWLHAWLYAPLRLLACRADEVSHQVWLGQTSTSQDPNTNAIYSRFIYAPRACSRTRVPVVHICSSDKYFLARGSGSVCLDSDSFSLDGRGLLCTRNQVSIRQLRDNATHLLDSLEIFYRPRSWYQVGSFGKKDDTSRQIDEVFQM